MANIRIHSLDELMGLMVRSTDALHDRTLQNIVIQSFANRLVDQYEIPRSVMRSLLNSYGFLLEECCIGCNEHMPNYVGTSDLICDDCHMDIDSVS